MKKIILIALLLLWPLTASAVMKHSPQNITLYKKYYNLVRQEPANKRALFEYSIILALMGRVEQAGTYLRKINELDENYAHTLVKALEQEKNRDINNWRIRFKLGFTYYFLFEEAHGRIALAERRLERAKENPRKYDRETLDREKDIIQEFVPLAEDYYAKALFNFKRVAEKKPLDGNNAWGYAYIAVIKGIADEWGEARDYCEKALEITPDAYALRAAYMEALKRNGNTVGAAAQMTTALSLKSEQDTYEKKLLGQYYE